VAVLPVRTRRVPAPGVAATRIDAAEVLRRLIDRRLRAATAAGWTTHPYVRRTRTRRLASLPEPTETGTEDMMRVQFGYRASPLWSRSGCARSGSGPPQPMPPVMSSDSGAYRGQGLRSVAVDRTRGSGRATAHRRDGPHPVRNPACPAPAP
jgi:hypothetical protein